MATEQELNRAKEIAAIEKERVAIKQKQNDLDSDSVGLSSSLVDSLKEIQGISIKRSTFDQNLLKVNKQIASEILGQRKGLQSIEAIDKQVLKNKEAILKGNKIATALESGIVGIEKKKLDLANARSTSIAEQRNIQEGLLADAEKSGVLDKEAYDLSVEKLAKDENSLRNITDQLSPMSQQAVFTRQNTVELERQNKLREDEKKEIEANVKKLGAFGGILKGISKIPLIGDLVDTEKIMGAAMDKVKETGSGVAGLGAGLKEAGKQVMAGLTNPANLALAAFTAIFAALLANNKKITEFERSMVMSSSEAKALAGDFAEVAITSDDINTTSANLVHTFTSLSEQFGFIAQFSMETLATATKLEKTVGVSAEAAGSLAAASELTGGSFDEQYKNALATSYELQRQTGVQFNLKGILEETSKVTGTVRANLGGNIEEIAKAVTQAKLFGASLEDVASAGNALLDFESSITKELEAELLIGRDINLEKARAAALAGDQVTLAQELQKEAGTLAEFQNMNVIQQQALAEAMGMTSDQMADILFQQEIQGKTAKELRALGKDELANRLEQQDAQQSFNAAVEQLKGLLADTVKFLDPIFQGFSAIVGAMMQMKELFLALTGIQLLYIGYQKVKAAMEVKSLVLSRKNFFMDLGKMALKGAQAVAGIPIVGPLLAVAALAGLYTAGKALLGDDVMSPGESGGGYGRRTLMGPEGAIALNNKDTVIAGTNLFPKGDDVMSTGAGEIKMPAPADNSRMEGLLESLVRDQRARPVIANPGVIQIQ